MKVWFITGCSSGIGAGIAKAVLEKGDCAVVTARHLDKVKKFEEQYPDTALAARLDVTDDATVDAALAAAMDRFGQIDCLINNAGHGYRTSVEEGTEEGIRECFETNFFGPVRLIQKVLPQMRKRRSGVIVNVSSIAGARAATGSAYYAASKAALERMSEALRNEVGPLGIKVMVVEPGAFRTNFYRPTNLLGGEKKIADYADTAWKRAPETVADKTDQANDPDKGGKLIVDMVESEKYPFRLIMGFDGVRVVETTLIRWLTELNEFREVSARTAYDINDVMKSPLPL